MLTIKRKQTLFSRFTIGTSVLPFVDMAWWAQTIAVIIKKINYTLQKRVVTCKKINSCEQGLHTTIVNILQQVEPWHNIFSCLCMYTCQFSCIMGESHACGLKTSILDIKDNSSHLTHKSGQTLFSHVQ